MDEIAIRVENVYKDFVLPHEKVTSIKGAFTKGLKRYKHSVEKQHALKDISFEIKKGEFFGIVGRNGSGKSTMLKILAGIYQPSAGKISVKGKLVPFIELGVGFNPELTGRENVFLNGAMLGFSKSEMEAMYDDIVKFAELERFMDQKLKNYSSGMQVRLAFSMATRAEADVLLVDEVLAVGDADFQRKCFQYFKQLKKNKKTVVFVTHDMSAIREFCDRALLIEDSRLLSVGKTQSVASQYSQLFIIDQEEVLKGVASKTTAVQIDPEGKRWGNGQLHIRKASSELKDKKVSIKAVVDVMADTDSLIYGLHIESQDGVEVTAMNNRMIQLPDIYNLKRNTSLEFEWSILNIFNDGIYYVNLTLVNETGVAYDWYTGATKFIVKREERSTTSVLPPVKVTYRIG